jgi:integration host factor subunit beta
MTRRGIIEELLARSEGSSYREAETIVNAIFEAMAAMLERGQRIEVRGFGSFAVKSRRARQGRNPKTGAAVAVEAKRVPFFRAGKELRAEVNGAAQAADTHPDD